MLYPNFTVDMTRNSPTRANIAFEGLYILPHIYTETVDAVHAVTVAYQYILNPVMFAL